MKQTINEAILINLAGGLTVKEISQKMYLSIPAINKRINQLKKSTDSKNVTELIAKAYQAKLIKV